MDSFVQRDGRHLTLDGERWYFSGSNNFWATPPFNGEVEGHHGTQVIERFDDLDLDVLRTWAFAEDEGLLTVSGGQLQPNEAALKKLDKTVALAREHDIRLVLTLTDYWTHFGGMRQYEAWSPNLDVRMDGSAGPEGSFYTDPQCKTWYKEWMETILTRTNTVTDREYRNEEAIMAFELANEPRARNVDKDVLHGWLEEMAAHFKSIDSNHLLSTGMEGFYHEPDATNWRYDGTEGTDYVNNHRIDDIDLCTFHVYPDNWEMDDVEVAQWFHEHVRDAHRLVGKPVYCGEFGKKNWDVRPNLFEQWYGMLGADDADGALNWMILQGDEFDYDGNQNAGFEIPDDDPETIATVTSYTDRVHRKVEDATAGTDDPLDPQTFVDECADFELLAADSDTNSLRVDTSNPRFFDRPQGGRDGVRFARDGTTDTTRLVYDFDTELDAVRIETHRNRSAGGQITVLESTDEGENFSSVDTETSGFGDVGAGGWEGTRHEAELSDGADQFAIELSGGQEAWSPQIGRVVIEPDGPATATAPNEPANPNAFVDECETLDELAGSADADALRVDTSNPKFFDRPNGNLNDARITRNGTTGTARLVYDIEDWIGAVRFESHRNRSAGGEVSLFASTDGGGSFSTVDTDRSEFGDVGEGGWVATDHKAALPAGVDRIAIELAGGEEAWSPQVGRVVLEPSSLTDEPAEPDDPEAIVDECETLDELDGSADADALRVDTSNPEFFDRPNGTLNDARITRDGTTDNARLVYDIDSEIEAVQFEAHRNPSAGGRVILLESTDGGGSFSVVETRRNEFGDSDGSGWVATQHRPDLSEDVDRIAIELNGGEEAWSPQVGRVILHPNDDQDKDLQFDLTTNKPTYEPGEEVLLTIDQYDPTDVGLSDVLWEFEDGTTGSGTILSHTFDSEGVHTVECIVTDERGQISTERIDVPVRKNQGIIHQLLDAI
jgi:mannan endo-1,4-beta-mannosidase